ncbi:MAG TPA: DUF349 domain-containing protein [Vicinamibacterales bacterium]|nr:DUF349 domain-containing protein [Vicinamibacterales bacterium]
MSFLDRFKPQPRWKHPDPEIRSAAIGEMPDDPEHRQIIAELAGSDEDLRVRRAAIGRVDAVEELVALAGREPDRDLRQELSERLVAVAIAPADSDGDAALALAGLDDQKDLSSVAKASPHDTIRTAALGRIHDTKILGSVARQAADPQTALDAAMRIADHSELLNVATRTEHRDAGVAALERAAEGVAAAGGLREILEQAANRAKSKAVSKRARAMIQAIDDAEAARSAALEAWQQRIAAVMARLEALVAAPSNRLQLEEAEAEWRELSGGQPFEIDQETQARFGAVVAEANDAIERTEREEAERRAEAERLAAIRAVRIALCDRVSALRGESVNDEVEKARAEWEGLQGPDEQEVEDAELRGRFEEACRHAIAREQDRARFERDHARLEELSQEAARLAAEEHPREHQWTAVVAEWQRLQPDAGELPPGVLERFQAAEAAARQREEDRRAAAEKALKLQVQRIDQLIERAHKRAPAEDLTLREADRAARELRAVIDAPPSVEEHELHAIIERVRAALTMLSPKLHELREMDEWKRFANAAVQEELIAKTEVLHAKYHFDRDEGPPPEEVEKAARELHDIQERWKQVAEAPRAQAQALWHRYRQAADPIQAKAREFFAHRAEERAGNLQKKLVIIERAEALADSTDWIKTADELKKLQAEWQQIGPVPRQDMKATWKRFRDACDRFFTRRNADLAQRKEVWSANLAKKEALCDRAEQLAASRDWERAAAEIRRMQTEWKSVGPVRRNKSEAIWHRFRAACDTFFDRYKRRDEIELEAKQADREALVSELESLAPSAPATGAAVVPEGEPIGADGTDSAPSVLPADQAPASAPLPPGDLVERVRSLRTRWNQTTPVVRQGADPLSARFVGALERLIAGYPEAFKGTELDVEASRQKMAKLCGRVEGFVADVAGPAGSSKALADMLREALAANTIGGRAGEESKWRAMADEVRQAQSVWSRLGPVPGDAGRELSDRFHRACNRFFDQYRRKVASQQHSRGRQVTTTG